MRLSVKPVEPRRIDEEFLVPQKAQSQKMENFCLKGSYEGNHIEVGVRRASKPTNRIIIFVHGLYGVFDPLDLRSKVNEVANRVSSGGIAHTVQYSSSRQFSFPSTFSRHKRISAFSGKTFLEELDDLKIVVNFIISNTTELFKVAQYGFSLGVHGSSLGGTLAILMEEYFPYITHISLCGTGCGASTKTQPILSTILPERHILASIARYRGKLLLIQGSEDRVVPRRSGEKIIEAAILANAHLVVVPGANHSFTSIYGVDDGSAQSQFVELLLSFFTDRLNFLS